MNKRNKYDLIYEILLYLIIAVFLIPTIWVLFTAVRPELELNSKPPIWIPGEITFDKVVSLFGTTHSESSVPFKSYLLNSIIAALSSSLTATILGTLAGYAFARFNFKGKRPLFLSFMLIRAIPGIALSLPLFVVFARLKLIDKTYGLSIVYVALSIPFIIWLMAGYFKDIPKELDDSAQTDGCSRMQAFLKIDLPLAWPGIGASFTFVFLTCWNEFQIANILTRTTASKTFPVGLFDFTTEFTIDWRGMAAMSIIMLIPAVLFVLFTQRNLVKALTFGAVKG